MSRANYVLNRNISFELSKAKAMTFTLAVVTPILYNCTSAYV